MAEAKVFPILGIDFTASQPYDAGHVLTEAEAKQLNQVRKENLGNNFRSVVKTAQEEAEKAGGTVDAADLQAKFAKLDSEYVFTLSTVAASRKLDPVEREARALVRNALREHFAAQTPPKKLSDIPDDELEALIEKNAQRDDIVKVAKNIVKQRQNAAGLDLSIGGGDATGGEAPAAQ